MWRRDREGAPASVPGLGGIRDTRGDTPELARPPGAAGCSPPQCQPLPARLAQGAEGRTLVWREVSHQRGGVEEGPAPFDPRSRGSFIIFLFVWHFVFYTF